MGKFRFVKLFLVCALAVLMLLTIFTDVRMWHKVLPAIDRDIATVEALNDSSLPGVGDTSYPSVTATNPFASSQPFQPAPAAAPGPENQTGPVEIQNVPAEVDAPASTYSNEEFPLADVPAEFPGGISNMMSWMDKNINYPENHDNIQGKVLVGFVVEADGSISNVKILKGLDRRFDEEAVRCVSSMPKWKPAMYKGRPVPSRYTFPIHFMLN